MSYGPAFRYKHKENGTYAPRNMYKNIHSSKIHNRNNPEMFIHVRIDSDISHAIEYYTTLKMSEIKLHQQRTVGEYQELHVT